MTVGTSHIRIDALSKVTGMAQYPGDLVMSGMAHAKVLFARHPHARVLSIDTLEAAAVPGVLAIFTGADLPVNEYGLVLFDAPVLVTPHSLFEGSGRERTFDGTVRHEGEKIALVVAESESIAENARCLIKVAYEDLPLISTMQDALLPTSLQIHPHYPDNVMHHYKIRRGDIEAGFSQADIIITDTYFTGAQEHAYLQPEAGIAYIDQEGRVTVQVAGQWAHEDQEQIAHALGLAKDQVRVIYPAIGGAFGGREDMSVQIVLALAALKLKRPVKIVWSREESIIGHHKRHPVWARARLGAKKDGTLVAAEVEMLADAGPYAYTSTKVLGNATVMCVGPYSVPNVKIDSRAVVTNNIPSGAFRGFGAPQALFIAETQMNKLAAALRIDPVALRLKNALQEGSLTVNNSPIPPGCTITDVIQKCAFAPEVSSAGDGLYKASRYVVGHGFACGHKNIGFSFGAPEQCEATVELVGKEEIERAIVYHAGADCGQGAHTVLMQVAAEVLGIPFEKITLVASDTATSGSSGSASASRLTFMASHSIVGAAQAAIKKWCADERPAHAHFVYRPRATTPMHPETGECDPNITYGYVAQSADIVIDTETGQLHVLRLVCADDVGRAINPQQVVGQIEGGVVQGLGWTALENFVQRSSKVITTHLSTYLIPSVLDVPDVVQSILVENPDPHGAMGIRGMAEMPFLVVAPAVVAAIHDASGLWINEIPVTPERLRSALIKKSK